MRKYEVVIYWSQEDSAYITEVPELPQAAQVMGEAMMMRSKMLK